jgi:hypothetical protein
LFNKIQCAMLVVLAIVISSWWPLTIINVMWTSFSLFTNPVLKSVLSGLSIALHAWLEAPFWSFHTKEMFVFVKGFICCKQQIIWLSILIHSAFHSLFVGEFRPWVFIVITKRYVVFPIITSFYDTCFFACSHLLLYSDNRIYVCYTFLNCLCCSSIFIIPLSIFYCVHLLSWISLVLFTLVCFHPLGGIALLDTLI